jgi:hypothetical protein
MQEPKALSHNDISALLAAVKQSFSLNTGSVARRAPFGDGYWVYLENFRVAITKYPFQGQYMVQVWSHEDDAVIAQTDGYVNWSAACLLFDLVKSRRLGPTKLFDVHLRHLEECLRRGQRLIDEEIAAGKKPQA